MRLDPSLAPLTLLTLRTITEVGWSRQSKPTREMELYITFLTFHDRYGSLYRLTYRTRLTIGTDPLPILFSTLFRALNQTSFVEGLLADLTLFEGRET